MLTYWDTSAVLNAVVSPAVEARLDTGKHLTSTRNREPDLAQAIH